MRKSSLKTKITLYVLAVNLFLALLTAIAAGMLFTNWFKKSVERQQAMLVTRTAEELDDKIQSAQATLEETRVRIKEAEINFRRTTDLAKSSISAQSELDSAEAELNSLKARLQQQEALVTVAQRELASWQQNLEDTIIRAPFAGIVTSKNAQPGEMISPVSAGGGFTRTGICTIVDMASLEIEIDVNESYINRVQPGQPVAATLDAYPDWKIPSRVIAIIPTADRQKSTVRVRVGFDFRSQPPHQVLDLILENARLVLCPDRPANIIFRANLAAVVI